MTSWRSECPFVFRSLCQKWPKGCPQNSASLGLVEYGMLPSKQRQCWFDWTRYVALKTAPILVRLNTECYPQNSANLVPLNTECCPQNSANLASAEHGMLPSKQRQCWFGWVRNVALKTAPILVRLNTVCCPQNSANLASAEQGMLPSEQRQSCFGLVRNVALKTAKILLRFRTVCCPQNSANLAPAEHGMLPSKQCQSCFGWVRNVALKTAPMLVRLNTECWDFWRWMVGYLLSSIFFQAVSAMVIRIEIWSERSSGVLASLAFYNALYTFFCNIVMTVVTWQTSAALQYSAFALFLPMTHGQTNMSTMPVTCECAVCKWKKLMVSTVSSCLQYWLYHVQHTLN